MIDFSENPRGESARSLLVERGFPRDVFEVDIPASHLRIDAEEVERTLGYPARAVPAHLRPEIERILADVPQHCMIRAGFRILDVRYDPLRSDGLSAGGSFFRMQKIVTRLLRKAEKLAFFVCTIGPGMESWAEETKKHGDLVGAFLIDTVASLAVENAANMLHDHVGRSMGHRGMKITNRYSPGYCDWSVGDQHLVFGLFPEDFCGITLLESALMVPLKSISGVIGIGPAVSWARYHCDACGMKDCTYRSVRKRPVARNASTRHTGDH